MIINVDEPIQFAGICLHSHETEGSIQTSDAATSLDGNLFTSMKQRLFDYYAKCAGYSSDEYGSLLVLFHASGSSTIYIDELRIEGALPCRIDGSKAGLRCIIQGMDIPGDAGLMVLIGYGEHKLAMYDVTPVASRAARPGQKRPTNASRMIDHELILGSLVNQILAFELEEITEEEWSRLFQAGWFPFAFLQGSLNHKLLQRVNAKEELGSFAAEVAIIITATWRDKIARWRIHPILRNEIPFLESAFDCFLGSNWIAASSVLGPRIEGIMIEAIGCYKTHFPMISAFGDRAEAADPGNQIIKVDKLVQYLRDVVFTGGNMMKPDRLHAGLNRHLLGHGRAQASSLGIESAVIRFLLIDHISRYWPVTEE
jgi:hypothetical protein